jgi:hypothetical protein
MEYYYYHVQVGLRLKKQEAFIRATSTDEIYKVFSEKQREDKYKRIEVKMYTYRSDKHVCKHGCVKHLVDTSMLVTWSVKNPLFARLNKE